MTGEEQREKVIAGLEWALENMIDPMNDFRFLGYDGPALLVNVPIIRDAITLLKAQEPRVMELEEVKKLQKNDVVWLEVRANNKGAIPVIVRSRYVWPHSTVMVIDFVDSSGCTITIQEEDFCYRDRCWTSRPTEEQMEAIPWA